MTSSHISLHASDAGPGAPASSSGVTPLMKAVAEDNVHDVLDILLNKKGNVNVKDENGRTALMYAVNPPFWKSTTHPHLTGGIHADEDIGPRGTSTMVKLLLEFNADLNAQDKEGNQALHIAAMLHDKNLVETLLQYKPKTKLNKNRQPPEKITGFYHKATYRSRGDNPEARKRSQLDKEISNTILTYQQERLLAEGTPEPEKKKSMDEKD